MTQRLAVIAPNWIGDAVMALPAIADVRRHYETAQLTIAARPSIAPLFTIVPGVDAIVTLPGGGGLRALGGWRDDVRALSAGSFDTAVLFPNSFASAFIASRAGIPERWGFAGDGRSALLTKAIAKPHGEMLQHTYYQSLIAKLGIEIGPQFARVTPDGERARLLLREIGLDVDEPFIAIAPGAAYGRAKQWLPERFAEVAHRIINERGWSVVMVGSIIDRDACADIARRLPKTGTRINRLIDFSGKSDIPTLAGILSQARAVVSNDSGAAHLAAAAGTRVLTIFGPTNERRTAATAAGPDAPAPVVVKTEVFCRPCMLRECPIDHRCMRRISAADVLKAI